MVDFTVDKFDRLDVAFNNAGVEWKGRSITLPKLNTARFRYHVWGVLNSMRHEIPGNAEEWRRAIVNNSSVAGHVAWARSVSTLLQAPVEGLTKSVALEFARQTSASMRSLRW